jgi:hypothetical protein
MASERNLTMPDTPRPEAETVAIPSITDQDTDELRIGDLVKGITPATLHCGSGVYECAVVVSVDPFVLVSQEGDMLWGATITPGMVQKCGRAGWRECYAAFGRYAFELKLPESGWRNREKKDAVTVGQIRKRYLATLESEISELANLIRKGYHNRGAAEKFLNENIGRTLTALDNLDAMASTEALFPAKGT